MKNNRSSKVRVFYSFFMLLVLLFVCLFFAYKSINEYLLRNYFVLNTDLGYGATIIVSAKCLDMLEPPDL